MLKPAIAARESLLVEPASQPQIVTPNTLEMKRPTEPNFAFSKRVSHKLVITIWAFRNKVHYIPLAASIHRRAHGVVPNNKK